MKQIDITLTWIVASVAVFLLILIVIVKPSVDTAYECVGSNGLQGVVVKRNDTISDIAAENCTGNMQAATYALVEVYGSEIFPGQLIQLP